MKKIALITIASLFSLGLIYSVVSSTCSSILGIYSNIKVNEAQLADYESHVKKMYEEYPKYTDEERDQMEHERLWFESKIVERARQIVRNLNSKSQFKQ